MRHRAYKVTAPHKIRVLLAVAWSCVMAAAVPPSQRTFTTPQEAVDALMAAAESFDVPKLLEIFGSEGKDLVSTEDPVQDSNNAFAFAARARTKNQVAGDKKNAARVILTVGDEEWPFPVPIVKTNGKWLFKTQEGRDELLFRRIGTNELDAIQVCRGFVEAQMEYASMARELTGVAQYAQQIFSSPGKRDGLYWQNADGSHGGPVSEPVARAISEGYAPVPGTGYHGYLFKVLKGQGPAAPLGELDYAIKGIMIGGFALLAVPAEYGVTGVATFMVGYDGVVYQKDLGPESLTMAKQIERYNPDKTWKPTDDEWPRIAIKNK